MPALRWLMQTAGLREGARVLLEHPAAEADPVPVVLMQFVGAGKVIFHATDESWRWRGNPDGEEYYQHQEAEGCLINHRLDQRATPLCHEFLRTIPLSHAK